MRRGLLRSMAEILPEPNTFIGGVGLTSVTSAQVYADATNLNLSDIENFQIDANNNVSFYVSKNYNIVQSNTNFLYADSDLTYFIDLDGFLITATGLQAGTISGVNLTHIYIPNYQGNVSRRIAFDCTSLLKSNIGFTLSTFSTGRVYYRANLLQKIVLPYAETLSMNNSAFYAFDTINNLNRIYIPLVNEVDLLGTRAAKDTAAPGYFHLINGNPKVYYNVSLGLGVMPRNAFLVFSVSALITAGEFFSFNGLQYTAVIGDPTTDGEFRIDVLNNGIRTSNVATAMQNDTRTGTISPKPFFAMRTGNVLVESLQTGQAFADAIPYDLVSGNSTRFVFTNLNGVSGFIGGDDVHPLIMYLRDNRNCTLIQCDPPITVDPPSNLFYLDSTEDSVILIFDEPTPNANGTETFEVWIDDGTIYRKLFDYTEMLSSGGTLDLSEIFIEQGTIDGVKVKVRTMDGQMNFSEFSNEITIT